MQKAKKVDVKLYLDGDNYRARVESKGRTTTKTSGNSGEILKFLTEEFDELYRVMRKELDNAAGR